MDADSRRWFLAGLVVWLELKDNNFVMTNEKDHSRHPARGLRLSCGPPKEVVSVDAVSRPLRRPQRQDHYAVASISLNRR